MDRWTTKAGDGRVSRRHFVQRGAAAASSLLLWRAFRLQAQALSPLKVASAGSFRAVLEGSLKAAAAKQLGLDLQSHTGGADVVARSIVDGSLQADVFVPITASPMRALLQAGRAAVAYPIASTEMVILYSPKSRFASQFAAAAQGHAAWWKVLQEPGVRFARSNPLEDPSGRAILFTMQLAAKKYNVPDLPLKVLGAPMNPQQVQPGRNVRAALEDGTVDAAGSYRIATGSGQMPFVPLPPDVNLSRIKLHEGDADLLLSIQGRTFSPEPLVFYAAVLNEAKNQAGAARFVERLRSKQASALLQADGFAPPDEADPLR